MNPFSQLAPNGEQIFPEGIILHRQGGVLKLTIDRINDLNRLMPEVLLRIESITQNLQQDSQTQVLIITGQGEEFFSMGIMNPVIRASYSKDQVLQLVQLANRTFDAIEALPQIVIAAFNGKALAGAVELSLACDLRYAASHATLCMPEAKWGGFPGGGGPVRLPQIVGRARAIDLICSAREISTEQMQEYGLIQGVYPSSQLQTEVLKIATTMASHGPLAIRGAKRIIDTRQAPGFRPARELADTLRRHLEYSHDVDEGLIAHRDNRTPHFIGK